MQLGTTNRPASLGPYEIRGPLGRGGMGEVYRAWDPRLQREVALKVLREHAETDPERLRRFVAEARAASALNHPNILTVFDAAVDGAVPYIVSELIEGDPLRDEVRRGPLPLKRLLDLATQIADGLAHAHAAGIVHRDLKPENIMVTRAGRAKILDFGLARPMLVDAAGTPPAALDHQTITEPGLLAGTVPYMSPEQARGGASDFRSDQFSFGLVLYEMATGQAAFRRETPARTLEAIASEEPKPLPPLNPQAPLLLWWIIERCLAKDPDDRYGLTADLHRDLRMLRDRLAEAVAREPGAAPSGARRSFVRRAVMPVMAVALVAAAALIWRMGREAPPFDLAALRFTPLATDAAYEDFPAWSPKGDVIAYAAEVDGVLQILTRGVSSPTAVPVTTCAYDCKHPFWAPDGTRIYYVSLAQYREGIWSVGSAGGTPQLVVENATRGAISPDGRTLAFLRDDARADIVGTAALWLSTPVGAPPKRYEGFGLQGFIDGVLAFSPDGGRLGLCVVPGRQDERMWQFWIVPLPAGRPYKRLESLTDAGPRLSSFTWLDNRHVALGMQPVAAPGSHLWVADIERDRAWQVTHSADSEHYPSASPDGNRLAFTRGHQDYDLVRIPSAGGPPQAMLATSGNESDPVWSPDGRYFAYVTDRSGQDEIWVRARDGSSDRPAITQRDFGGDRTVMLSAPAFSPDGQRIAYQRNGFKPRWPLRIWISFAAGGMPSWLLPPTHDGLQSAPTWSPDGQWIAYAQWRGNRWELAKVRLGSGEGPVVLRTDGVANATPHWSPANDWITWETGSGVVLVSPDGGQQRSISTEQWLAHTWAPNGSQVFGITETDELRLSLVAVDARAGTSRVIADLGPSPPVNNPVKGLSVSTDGRTFVTSMVRARRGDLWLLDGIRPRRGLPASLWPGFP